MGRRLALPLLLALVAAVILWRGARSREVSEPASPATASEPSRAPADSLVLEQPEKPEGSTRANVPSEEPAAPGPEVAVTVSTRKARGKRAKAVPSVAIAVGVGLPLDPGAPSLATAITDAKGLARVAIPWGALEAARGVPGAVLWARVTGPRLQAQTASAPLPEAPVPITLELVTRTGATVRGRLLAAEELPVPGTVRVKGQLGFGSGEAGEDGWFAIHVAKEGTYALFAEADGHGTAAVRDLDVRFGPEANPIEVHLIGPGVVRGRVRDPTGPPAARLDLLVRLASVDEGTGEFMLFGPEVGERVLEGRGRIQATVSTDADGAFEVRGLRADEYVVRARTPNQWGGSYPNLLTRDPVPSDGVPLELSFGRPHLVVRLVKEDGSPWAGPVTVHSTMYWGDELPPYWPGKPRLVVVPANGDASLSGGPPYVNGCEVKGGEYVFEVEEGRRYLVGLIGGALRWRPVEHFHEEGTSRAEVTLTVAESPGRGALLVTVRDGKGAALESGFAIRVEDPYTGMPLVVHDPFPRATWPFRLELPEGEYRLAVEGAASIDEESGILLAERRHGRFETVVRVLAGQVTTVRATLREGARLRLRLSGSVSEEDRAVMAAYDLPDEDIDQWAAKSSLALLADGRWPDPILFRREWTDSSGTKGASLEGDLALGSEETSEILPAGKLRIEARLPGGRVVTAPVVLVDGETTEVELSFDG